VTLWSILTTWVTLYYCENQTHIITTVSVAICLRFEYGTSYTYTYIYNNCAAEKVPKKKIIINKLVRVRKHIIIIRLWLENFLVGINFSVSANQTAKHHKPVMCGVPMSVIYLPIYIGTALTVLTLFQSTQTFVHFLRINARNWFIKYNTR